MNWTTTIYSTPPAPICCAGFRETRRRHALTEGRWRSRLTRSSGITCCSGWNRYHKGMPPLDTLDHVAIPVQDVASAVDWYTGTFHCKVKYQDESWALLDFDNVRLALVIPSQHPAHIGFVSEEAERFGELK